MADWIVWSRSALRHRRAAVLAKRFSWAVTRGVSDTPRRHWQAGTHGFLNSGDDMKTFAMIQRIAIAVVTLTITTGCTASIDPKPYEEYRDAFRAVQSSSDRVLSVDYKWTHKTYVEKLAAGEDVTPEDLVLQFPVGDYTWELPSDDLLERIRKTQRALSSLNAAFAEYTSLLADLAGGSVRDGDTFKDMAKTLNERAHSAVIELGFDDEGDHVALFSAAAQTLAIENLNSSQGRALQEILAENQAGVESFAQTASDGVKLVARDLKAEYQNHAERLINAWTAASDARKRRLADDLLDLNADTIAYLEALEALDKGYSVLAEMHSTLSDSDGQFSVARLLVVAADIETQYEELR